MTYQQVDRAHGRVESMEVDDDITQKRQMKDQERLQELVDWLNGRLGEFATAEQRLQFVLNHVVAPSQKQIAVTTSFGITSALMIHLVSQATISSPYYNMGTNKVPIIWIDTGYLPKETYAFAERLREHYELDLHVYQSSMSPARMEAMYGKLWEDESLEAHRSYNYIRKVEPMNRALKDLNVSVMISGVRSNQTEHRQSMKFANLHDGRIKICPVLDWSNEQVATYFEEHDLLYHPLKYQNYRTVGDWHSSHPYDPNKHSSERDTRFHGRTQECGLHLPTTEVTLIPLSPSSSKKPKVQLVMDNGGFVLYTKPNCRYCKGAKALIEHISNELSRGHDNSDDYYDSSTSSEEGMVTVVSTTTVATMISSTSDLSLSSSSWNLPVDIYEVDGINVTKNQLEMQLNRPITTVPQILYKGHYIGGYTDLVSWLKRTYPQMELPDTDKLVEKQQEVM